MASSIMAEWLKGYVENLTKAQKNENFSSMSFHILSGIFITSSNLFKTNTKWKIEMKKIFTKILFGFILLALYLLKTSKLRLATNNSKWSKEARYGVNISTFWALIEFSTDRYGWRHRLKPSLNFQVSISPHNLYIHSPLFDNKKNRRLFHFDWFVRTEQPWRKNNRLIYISSNI